MKLILVLKTSATKSWNRWGKTRSHFLCIEKNACDANERRRERGNDNKNDDNDDSGSGNGKPV